MKAMASRSRKLGRVGPQSGAGGNFSQMDRHLAPFESRRMKTCLQGLRPG